MKNCKSSGRYGFGIVVLLTGLVLLGGNVEAAHRVPLRQQLAQGVLADVAEGAGEKDFHVFSPVIHRSC